ncbi:MAG: hypothetical protein AAF414_07045 [Pseudomonadota bacterium]
MTKIEHSESERIWQEKLAHSRSLKGSLVSTALMLVGLVALSLIGF